MPQVTTIYWRDIPALVVARQGRKRARQKLSNRFQETIDRAAMRAKKTDADAYLGDWHQVNQATDGALERLVVQTARQLEADYDDLRLDGLARNKGNNPDSK